MSGRNISTNRNPSEGWSRRSFLKYLALSSSAVLLSAGGVYHYLSSRASRRTHPATLSGASFEIGHRLLKEGRPPTPTQVEQIETIIVGGGIAGLSAAWWLNKSRYQDFVLLELENGVGGNSQFRENAISRYPLGAHYLPLPDADARLVRLLLEECGVIRGYDNEHRPIYDELYLCSDPKERLLIHGRWHEGLLPQVGLSPADRQQYQEFFTAMEMYKHRRGRDGKKAFTIPIDFSSQDPNLLALDNVSMATFMQRKGWTSPYLNWYVNYGCRDDYGVGHDHVSAWAGIHYFASRAGVAANADAQDTLTWPEGNGWLVARMEEKFLHRVRPDSFVYSIAEDRHGVAVDYLNPKTGRHVRIRGKQVVFAAPRFVARKIIKDVRGRVQKTTPAELHYAPWLVANISLRTLPSGSGAPTSWDNVSYHSRSLGYIVATHQHLSPYPQKTVITYYLPLDQKDPAAARKEAIKKTRDEWSREIADDLERMHPGIAADIENIDVWLWGHGMSSPGIGFLWGAARQKMVQSLGSIHFAHSDMSGISIFEEAQYRGVQAATKVLTALGRKVIEI